MVREYSYNNNFLNNDLIDKITPISDFLNEQSNFFIFILFALPFIVDGFLPVYKILEFTPLCGEYYLGDISNIVDKMIENPEEVAILTPNLVEKLMFNALYYFYNEEFKKKINWFNCLINDKYFFVLLKSFSYSKIEILNEVLDMCPKTHQNEIYNILFVLRNPISFDEFKNIMQWQSRGGLSKLLFVMKWYYFPDGL